MEVRVKSRAERMIENYAARLRAGQVGCRRDGLTEAQAQRFAAAVARTNRIRAETAAILDAAGMPMIVRPYYYSFALKLGKLAREAWSEHSRREEARILVSTWTARGLAREVLVAIARDLFSIDPDRAEPPA